MHTPVPGSHPFRGRRPPPLFAPFCRFCLPPYPRKEEIANPCGGFAIPSLKSPFSRKKRTRDEGVRGTPRRARKVPPPTGGRSTLQQDGHASPKKRTRDEGRNSGLETGIQVLFDGAACLHTCERRGLLGSRERLPLQNSGTKCLNSDTLGTNRIDFRCLLDVNRCKPPPQRRRVIVVYTAKWSHMAAAPQTVPGGRSGRPYAPRGSSGTSFGHQVLRKGACAAPRARSASQSGASATLRGEPAGLIWP